MYHPKILIADRSWVTVGSANLDERSLKLNDEANISVFGSEFADTQIAIFDEDLTNTRQISLDEWEHRALADRLTEWLASMLRNQL